MSEVQIHPAEKAFHTRYAALPIDPERAQAFARFVDAGLPHRRMEAWRWSDLRQALTPKTTPNGATAQVSENTANLPALANAIVFKVVAGQLRGTPDLPDGVTLAADDWAAHESVSPLQNLAQALAPTAITVHIDGSQDAPLLFAIEGSGNTRIHIVCAPGSEVSLIENHELTSGFANTILTVELGKNARVLRMVHQCGDADAVQAINAHISLAENTHYQQYSLSFGAKLARMETHVIHDGIGAKAVLNGTYMLDGDRHADQTYTVEHLAEQGVTDQLVRGVVKDKARGVFQGKFYVARNGQQTDAKMAHNAILLNAGASVNAKPELEIYADDVACAHGNTCGELDDDALFYMRQRGLDEAAAKTLLTSAFLGAAFDDLGDENLRDLCVNAMNNWLELAL